MGWTARFPSRPEGSSHEDGRATFRTETSRLAVGAGRPLIGRQRRAHRERACGPQQRRQREHPSMRPQPEPMRTTTATCSSRNRPHVTRSAARVRPESPSVTRDTIGDHQRSANPIPSACVPATPSEGPPARTASEAAPSSRNATAYQTKASAQHREEPVGQLGRAPAPREVEGQQRQRQVDDPRPPRKASPARAPAEGPPTSAASRHHRPKRRPRQDVRRKNGIMPMADDDDTGTANSPGRGRATDRPRLPRAAYPSGPLAPATAPGPRAWRARGPSRGSAHQAPEREGRARATRGRTRRRPRGRPPRRAREQHEHAGDAPERRFDASATPGGWPRRASAARREQEAEHEEGEEPFEHREHVPDGLRGAEAAGDGTIPPRGPSIAHDHSVTATTNKEHRGGEEQPVRQRESRSAGEKPGGPPAPERGAPGGCTLRTPIGFTPTPGSGAPVRE